MTYIVRSAANAPRQKGWTIDRPSTIARKPKKLDITTRRYEISWLDEAGNIEDKTLIAPAMPIFEEAFSAFAQGTLLQTENGHVAIEDLLPGDRLATADNGLQKIVWIGSMTMFPKHLGLNVPTSPLWRITDGICGHDQQSPDLIVGPGARILPALLATDSSSPLLAPRDLMEEQSIIEINPVSQVRVFHVILENHSLVRANGVLCESYHPGSRAQRMLPDELMPHFVALFPQVSSLGRFGQVKHSRLDG